MVLRPVQDQLSRSYRCRDELFASLGIAARTSSSKEERRSVTDAKGRDFHGRLIGHVCVENMTEKVEKNWLRSTTATSGDSGWPMRKKRTIKMIAVNEPIVTPDPKMICSGKRDRDDVGLQGFEQGQANRRGDDDGGHQALKAARNRKAW